jgi:hypothetical protein
VAWVVGCRRRRGGDTLRIDVCDTGSGIPKDQRRSIFGEFYPRKESAIALMRGDAILWPPWRTHVIMHMAPVLPAWKLRCSCRRTTGAGRLSHKTGTSPSSHCLILRKAETDACCAGWTHNTAASGNLPG